MPEPAAPDPSTTSTGRRPSASGCAPRPPSQAALRHPSPARDQARSAANHAATAARPGPARVGGGSVRRLDQAGARICTAFDVAAF